jgi:orotidine-5'-phosphate decarboxylase
MTDVKHPAHPAHPARDHLALVLDTDDLVAATRLARAMEPWFGIVKVGLELYYATGPEAVVSMRELGFGVFCDLKLHDIPTQVGRACRVLGALGADYVTLHAAGGLSMLQAGVDGLRKGAEAAGLAPPVALAVTVLTSDGDAPANMLAHRVAMAVEARCDGIVCSPLDVREAKLYAPRLVAMVPGIRLPGTPTHDQARSATPAEAIAAGADVLVIGRTVTGANDPRAAAVAVADAVAATLDRTSA